MFGKRLVSGIILVILAAFILIQGGPILFFVSLGLSLIGIFELYRVLKIEKEIPGAIGYLAVLGYYFILWTGHSEYVTFLVVALVLSLMTAYVFTFPKYQTEHIMSSLFGVFYVGVLLSFVYQVRSHGRSGRLSVRTRRTQAASATCNGTQHLRTLLNLESLFAEPHQFAMRSGHSRRIHHQRMFLVLAALGDQCAVVLIVYDSPFGTQTFSERTCRAVVARHRLAQRQEIAYQGTHTDATSPDEIYRLYRINVHVRFFLKNQMNIPFLI